MSLVTIVRRGSGIGLGWLLAFSLGGAVLLFTCIGLLLAWRIKGRPQHATTTVYGVSMDASTDDHPRFGGGFRDGFGGGFGLGLPRRLTKRKYVMTSSTSGLTLSTPPVLPRLPRHQSFGLFDTSGGAKLTRNNNRNNNRNNDNDNANRGSTDAARKRSRSWVDEDRLHGPKVNKNIVRESWFARDGWLGKVPTLPSLFFEDSEKGSEADMEADQMLHVQKQRQQQGASTVMSNLKASQTAPELTPVSSSGRPQQQQQQQEPFSGRLRVPAQAHVRTSATDSDLRDILRSTEKRLRDGRLASQSQTHLVGVTPSSTPPKSASPVKTLHSQASTVSTLSQGEQAEEAGEPARVSRISANLSKRVTMSSAPAHVYTHSRNASVSTIGSAAHSLIDQATQELVLPGGLSSPSRLRGRQWDEEPSPPKRPRSASSESEVSSSLSTVYSLDEREEKRTDIYGNRRNDPFTEAPANVTGRSAKRRSRSGALQLPPQPKTSPLRLQLRHPSVSTGAVGGPLSIVLQTPDDRRYESDADGFALAFPASESITSMVTPSVTTNDGDTIRAARPSESLGQMTPKSRAQQAPEESPSTERSSPFDENDMLSMLMDKRHLPEPPRHYSHIDESMLPTPLSPRPRRDFSHQLRQMSIASTEASEYEEADDDPSAVSNGSPGRRRARRLSSQPPAGPPPMPADIGSVGNSIAELRRMNSMMSSYSVASLTSMYGDPALESPTLPALRGGGFSPHRTSSKTSTIGRQNYLNLGSSPRRGGGGGGDVGIREDEAHDSGKENRGAEATKQPARLELPAAVTIGGGLGLREARRSGNQGREAASRKLLGTVTELGDEQRSRKKSADSLGLYDPDGFLRSSPEREVKGFRV